MVVRRRLVGAVAAGATGRPTFDGIDGPGAVSGTGNTAVLPSPTDGAEPEVTAGAPGRAADGGAAAGTVSGAGADAGAGTLSGADVGTVSARGSTGAGSAAVVRPSGDSDGASAANARDRDEVMLAATSTSKILTGREKSLLFTNLPSLDRDAY